RFIKAPQEELYDLERDPHERQNIVDDRARAQTHDALRGALDRLVAGVAIDAPGDVSAEDRERLQALGYVGAQTDVTRAAADTLPDPKDKRQILDSYRDAVQLASEKKWGPAIALLQKILKEDPEMLDVWGQLATFAIRADRYEQAIDAYKHMIELKPSDPTGFLGAAAAMLKVRKLDDARAHAELAASVAGDD